MMGVRGFGNGTCGLGAVGVASVTRTRRARRGGLPEYEMHNQAPDLGYCASDHALIGDIDYPFVALVFVSTGQERASIDRVVCANQAR